MIADENVRMMDKLRLVMLYALRYESHTNNDVHGLVDTLTKRGLPEKDRRVGRVRCTLSGKIREKSGKTISLGQRPGNENS